MFELTRRVDRITLSIQVFVSSNPAKTGMTTSIDPYGRIVAATGRKIRTVLAAPYALSSGTTFYTRHGDWFAYLCAIISAGALMARYVFTSER